jgi:uncharacterized protein
MRVLDVCSAVRVLAHATDKGFMIHITQATLAEQHERLKAEHASLKAAYEKKIAIMQATMQSVENKMASLEAARQQDVARLQKEADQLRAELALSQALKARIHGAAGNITTMLGQCMNDFASIITALRNDAGPLNPDD